MAEKKAKKVYAVKKGRQTGLFDTWEACRSMVHGYSGAVYKSFKTRQEAADYLNGVRRAEKDRSPAQDCGKSAGEKVSGKEVSGEKVSGKGVSREKVSGKEVSGEKVSGKKVSREKAAAPGHAEADLSRVPPHRRLVAYVDGSFDQKLGRYSFGCILLTPDGKIYEESGSGGDPRLLALRNVTGEMLGAMTAVRWALRHGFQALDIRYDYAGIENWAEHSWKAKNELTQKYTAYMDRCRSRIVLTFTKIAAHTGDLFNEAADALAKEALASRDGMP